MFCLIQVFNGIFTCCYFQLCWVFLAARRLSLGLSEQKATLAAVYGLSSLITAASPAAARSSAFASGVVAWAQESWYTGLVAPQHGGSPGSRGSVGISLIARPILNHLTTGEALLDAVWIEFHSIQAKTWLIQEHSSILKEDSCTVDDTPAQRILE